MKSDLLRKTKIVCTIGPASEKRLEELLNTGMNVARINFSHGSWDEQREKVEEFLAIRERLGVSCSLLLDMQGPEVRTGKLAIGTTEKIDIQTGQKFILVNEDILGDETRVSVSYKDLYKDLTPGSKVLIDDGSIQLVVDQIVDKDVHCTVTHGNKLGSRKTMNFPGAQIKLPALKEKDVQDLKDGVRAGFDYVAGSFIRNADDVMQIRKVLDDNGGQNVKIICKIENQEGIDNIDDIIEVSDGIMVARGDMAVEVPFEEVPVVQKDFIKKCNRVGKPVITATQMLESMTYNPLPTRAEVSDVANAVFDRTSAIMLSGECAAGKFPIECVEAMVRISKRTEKRIDYWKRFSKKQLEEDISSDFENTIAYSTLVATRNMKADAIVAYTNTGDSVRRIAGIGGLCPIFAITDNKKTYNQLAVVWNVKPVLIENESNKDRIVELGIQKLRADGILEQDDVIVVSGGRNFMDGVAESKQFGGYVKL